MENAMLGYHITRIRGEQYAMKSGTDPMGARVFRVLCEARGGGRFHHLALARDCGGAEAAVRGAVRQCARVISVAVVEEPRLEAVA